MNSPALRQRLATILFADVAGYSRLMGSDESATVAALDRARAIFRESVASAQGRVVDMAGDSVLAVFDSVNCGVKCALEVQRTLLAACREQPEDAKMRFRVGVHLGDIMEKGDGTVYGDGVNIAARLESLAEPGGIAISEPVLWAVKKRVDAEFEDFGEHVVKNIAEPVRAFRFHPDALAKVATKAAVAPAPPAGNAARPAAASEPAAPRPSAARDRADKPSIAVLPFVNMSGDPEQEFFADGITEDILTELSRFRELFVISRNSVVGSSRVDLQACKLEYSIVSPK